MTTGPKKTSVSKKLLIPAKAVVKKTQKKPLVTAKRPSNVTKQAPAKKVTKLAPKQEPAEELVFVPSTTSLRLLEKLELYKIWYHYKLPEKVATASKYAGYTFALLGVFLASFSSLSDKSVFNFAAVVCANEVCNNVPDSELPDEAPLVTFLNTIPSKIQQDIDFGIEVRNPSELKVVLESKISGNKTILNPVSSSENKFNYLIRIADIVDGPYEVKAEMMQGNTGYYFSGPVFSVEREVVDSNVEETKLEITEAEEVATSSYSTASSTEAELASVSTSTEPASELRIEEEVGSEINTGFTLSLKKQNDSNYLLIQPGDFLPDTIELFSLVPGTDNPLYLGQATLVNSEWFFSLEAINLPAIEQHVYASFTNDSEVFKSKSILYWPEVVVTFNADKEADNRITREKVENSLLEHQVSLETRRIYYSHISSSSDTLANYNYENEFVDGKTSNSLNDLLKKHETVNNLLLQNYASTFLSGDKSLQSLAVTKIESYYKSLALLYAEELSSRHNTTVITNALALRFDRLRSRVEQYESQFAETSNTLIARDSDLDGISDYDELTLYFSNPHQVDTDQDGVLDGVEIVSGFNPALPDVTSFVVTKPQTISNDILSAIEVVKPIIAKNNLGNRDVVLASIQGKSLPESFVLIAVEGIEKVGIIKTGPNGDFSYTFENPLIDGAYSVRVFYPTNDGNLVISTKPYIFNKKANQFSASVSASAHSYNFTMGSKTISLPHNVTASLGVVSFGLILILLSFTLRTEHLPKKLRKQTV